MDATNIIFMIISVLVIAFNTHIFYKGYKELKRSREELKAKKEAMLKELEKSYQEVKTNTNEN